MSTAAHNYCITEFELFGSIINIEGFSNLLRRVNFDVEADHLALTHIMKNKSEPANNKIQRSLYILSSYTFSLCYLKG